MEDRKWLGMGDTASLCLVLSETSHLKGWPGEVSGLSFERTWRTDALCYHSRETLDVSVSMGLWLGGFRQVTGYYFHA